MRVCEKIGFPISESSAQELCGTPAQFRQNLRKSIDQVLSVILMKSMSTARYFCSGTVENQASYHHYALNVPVYTHFTSRIRRYPDIIVHRLLATAQNYCEPSERSTEELLQLLQCPAVAFLKMLHLGFQAEHCNDKMLIAKKKGPVETQGVVVNVLDAVYDVLLHEYGVVKRVYVKALKMCRDTIYQKSSSKLTLFWETEDGIMEQTIQMCTVVEVILQSLGGPMKYEAVIKTKSGVESPTLFEQWCERANTSADRHVNNIDSTSGLTW